MKGTPIFAGGSSTPKSNSNVKSTTVNSGNINVKCECYNKEGGSDIHYYVLDTDLGYDPDDIMALYMMILFCTNKANNARLVVVTSAERYDGESSDGFTNYFKYHDPESSDTRGNKKPGEGVQLFSDGPVLYGKRAILIAWILDSLNCKLVDDVNILKDDCKNVMVISGLPGYAQDPASAKTRQYSTFIRKHSNGNVNYHQSIAGFNVNFS